ncbi:MAG: hypothetical protein KJ646_05610 [Nanoarchaeota archaeon]|nr:hypothetical protein [Nanoarchaeota archaeon]MBU4116188.1 hypothetical protein [Nanoarchaeota archaeon]
MENFKLRDKNKKTLIAILVGALVVLFAIITSLVLKFEIVENLVMSWMLTTFYGVFALFLVGDEFYIQKAAEIEKSVYIDRPVIHEIIREIEKPIEVIREVKVPIQIPVENQTIKVVEKPVIQRVEVPVYRDRNVYIEKSRKKLNIPHFNYIGSSQAKRFHARSCRLGKLIKKKFKISNNSQAFFTKKHFKACKICILHKKKI